MQVFQTALPEVLILEPQIFGDDRGFFYESFNQKVFDKLTGVNAYFVQDNHSKSAANVLRGLHYQIQQPQGKLVRVILGEVFDVVVDLRRQSNTFGQWEGTILSAENRRQIWIPPGFAHGYLVLKNDTELLYKTTNYYAPQYERCVRWDDPEIGIQWPLLAEPILSAKDKVGLSLSKADVFEEIC
jgi:dTDP-4-dehydrorhamnose 3,5-epimerase